MPKRTVTRLAVTLQFPVNDDAPDIGLITPRDHMWMNLLAGVDDRDAGRRMGLHGGEVSGTVAAADGSVRAAIRLLGSEPGRGPSARLHLR